MKNRTHFNLMANIFRYPGENYVQNVKLCEEIIFKKYPDIYLESLPFFKFVINEKPYKVEEVFNMTFHIQAICFLDIGYVLFAEDYKRGDFLVKIKEEQKKVGNYCGNELADNLPNILTLMAKIKDLSFLNEFAVRIVKPALEKMLNEFDIARIELKNKVRLKKHKVLLSVDEQNRNIYQYALQMLLKVILEDFKHVEYKDTIVQPTLGNFMKNCNSGCDSVKNIQTVK